MAANKYVNSKVYKLQHEDGHYYIGSTTQDLCKRLQDHKNASKRDKYKNIRIYDYIKNDGWEMVNIILIEKFELKDRSELLREEDRHIRLHRDDELCLNIRRALTTGDEKKEQMKEYYEQNKNKRKEQMKEYYEQNKDKLNKDKLKEQMKEYREHNKDKLTEQKKEYYEQNKDKLKEQKKEYYEQNKDKLKEQMKEYYEQNKDKLKEQMKEYREHNKDKLKEQMKEYREHNKDKLKEQIQCVCGCQYTMCNKSRHLKTKKHQQYIRTNEIP